MNTDENKAAFHGAGGKRVLILYQDMGSGHKRVAKLIETALHESWDTDILCIPGNSLLESRFMSAFETFWNAAMRRNWVRLADILGAFFTRIAILPLLDATIGPDLHGRLDSLKPDVIVSTMDGFNKALGGYCREAGIPFHIFVTSSAVFCDNVNANAHHLCYFKEMADAIRGFDLSSAYFSRNITRSIGRIEKAAYVLACLRDFLFPRGRGIFRRPGQPAREANGLPCAAVGLCVDSRFYARRQAGPLRRKLNIGNDNPCVLVASGALGSRAVSDAVSILAAGAVAPLNIVAVCGHDRATYERVRAQSSRDGKTRVIPLGFVDNFDEYLSLADCVVIRPSSGVFNETLAARTPCVVLPWATSSEQGIPWLVDRYRLGENCSCLSELPQRVRSVLDHREEYARNIDLFLAPYPQDFETTARAISQAILGDLTQEVRTQETALA